MYFSFSQMVKLEKLEPLVYSTMELSDMWSRLLVNTNSSKKNNIDLSEDTLNIEGIFFICIAEYISGQIAKWKYPKNSKLLGINVQFREFLRFKMTIPFYPESASSLKWLEFREGKASPFVIPISEYRNISKENSVFLIEFGSIPCACTSRIEEFAYNDWIFRFWLVSDFPKLIDDFLC